MNGIGCLMLVFGLGVGVFVHEMVKLSFPSGVGDVIGFLAALLVLALFVIMAGLTVKDQGYGPDDHKISRK